MTRTATGVTGWQCVTFPEVWTQVERSILHQVPDALEPRDISDVIPNTDNNKNVVLLRKTNSAFSDAELERLRKAALDVILHFGRGAAHLELVHCAKYGLWFVDFDGGHECAAAALENMRERNPVSRATLRVQRADEPSRILHRSVLRTDFSSLYRTINSCCWSASDFVIRKLSFLHDIGWTGLVAYASEPESRPDTPFRGVSTPVQVAEFLAAWSSTVVRNRVHQRFTRDAWRVAYRKRQLAPIVGGNLSGLTVIGSPADRFYADPFCIKKSGRNYIFFEDYRYRSAKGVISCVEIDSDGRWHGPDVILEKDYHLSYPFVWEWNGEIFLIPESRDANQVQIYRARKFPHDWVLEKLLDDFPGVDSTFFAFMNKIWMFTAIKSAAANTNLFLFFADSMLGDWTPHPKNPIVSDVRRARPAGQLFLEGSDIIRPGQDCSWSYGQAITLNRVEVLSETDYREVPVARILPDFIPGSCGTHTLNQTDDLQVIDIKVQIARNRAAGLLKCFGDTNRTPGTGSAGPLDSSD